MRPHAMHAQPTLCSARGVESVADAPCHAWDVVGQPARSAQERGLSSGAVRSRGAGMRAVGVQALEQVRRPGRRMQGVRRLSHTAAYRQGGDLPHGATRQLGGTRGSGKGCRARWPPRETYARARGWARQGVHGLAPRRPQGHVRGFRVAGAGPLATAQARRGCSAPRAWALVWRGGGGGVYLSAAAAALTSSAPAPNTAFFVSVSASPLLSAGEHDITCDTILAMWLRDSHSGAKMQQNDAMRPHTIAMTGGGWEDWGRGAGEGLLGGAARGGVACCPAQMHCRAPRPGGGSAAAKPPSRAAKPLPAQRQTLRFIQRDSASNLGNDESVNSLIHM